MKILDDKALSHQYYDTVIVGAGITGAVIAERCAKNGHRVLIIEKRLHIGGNCYDKYTKNGLLYHVYGPHIFHTSNKNVIDYLSNFTEWYDYEHRVLALIKGRFVPVPFNLTSIKICFSHREAKKITDLLINTYGYGAKVPILELLNSNHCILNKLSKYIYNMVFLNYTKKQWGMTPKELHSSVSSRVPIHISYDDRYFQDSFQKLPKMGYTQMVKNILTHQSIFVILGKYWEEIKNKIKYNRIVYTGPIDEYFKCCLGNLPYRSLYFKFRQYAQSKHQPVAQINYPNDHNFTRITEMAHFTQNYDTTTLIALEYPQPYVQGKNEPYYPIPTEKNDILYHRYVNLAYSEAPDVIFAGRLGKYKYLNMDKAISEALEILF